MELNITLYDCITLLSTIFIFIINIKKKKIITINCLQSTFIRASKMYTRTSLDESDRPCVRRRPDQTRPQLQNSCQSQTRWNISIYYIAGPDRYEIKRPDCRMIRSGSDQSGPDHRVDF